MTRIESALAVLAGLLLAALPLLHVAVGHRHAPAPHPAPHAH